METNLHDQAMYFQSQQEFSKVTKGNENEALISLITFFARKSQ